MITKKVFINFKIADTVLNFSFLAIKLPNFESVDEKQPELEPRVSYSFDIKLVSRKQAFKSFGVPSSPIPVKFFCLCMRYHNFFLAILKLYL